MAPWSWPWERTASAWVSGLENPSGLCHDARGWESRHSSWPWVPSHTACWALARRSLAELEICMSQGCWVGKLLYAGLPPLGPASGQRFRGLSSRHFPSLLMLLGRCILDHGVSLLAAGPLSCLIPDSQCDPDNPQHPAGKVGKRAPYPWPCGSHSSNGMGAQDPESLSFRTRLWAQYTGPISAPKDSQRNLRMEDLLKDLACSLSKPFSALSNDICHLFNTKCQALRWLVLLGRVVLVMTW